MSPTAVPARITIDFREALDPGHGWILGVDERKARVELLAFEDRDPHEPPTATAAAHAGCTCPEFCERDHDVD